MSCSKPESVLRLGSVAIAGSRRQCTVSCVQDNERDARWQTPSRQSSKTRLTASGIAQPASQPADQPADQPASQPASQPTSQPASQPARGAARRERVSADHGDLTQSNTPVMYPDKTSRYDLQVDCHRR